MTSKNLLDEKVCEQLSAWMDGELPRAEAMFLERRLQHDEALQAMYSRLQMTSACMKGQSARLMPTALSSNIKKALNEEMSSIKSRRPLLAWAAAASLAFAAVTFIPGMMQSNGVPEPKFANNNSEAISTPNSSATFASADLVANTPDAVNTLVVASEQTTVIKNAAVDDLPSSSAATDVEKFPLIVSSEKKTWPRSPVNANSDPALEAYLVRHNQMMAEDGMGGFVPYVDVVAQDIANKSNQTDTKENAGDNQ
jgi:anti-sigma factor RsiW